MPRALDKTISEILSKYGVDTSGDCWLWTRGRDSYGYAQASLGGKVQLVHRFVCRIATGEDIAGKVVMHTCDTPHCINPAHLRIGTQLDNIRDRVLKGRNGACRGDAAPWSKVNSEAVERLRRDFAAGRNRNEISQAYGISKTQMYRIVARESWA